MKNICFYFEIHQPFRLKRYRFFDIGTDHYYYDDFLNEEKIREVVERSYLPANRTIMEMISGSNKKFRCAFSISGVALEQLEQHAPEVIDSFKELATTGCVEFLAEPYAHSLASLYDENEFITQINQHADKIEELFGIRPIALRNAELIYSDEIGAMVSKAGYKTMLIEGDRQVLGWRSPNYVYSHNYIDNLRILVRNYKFSDDISFRFSDRSWNDFPLTAEKYVDWISAMPNDEQVLNIWMGYETLGVYQGGETGIFEFFKALPYQALERGLQFVTPSEVVKKQKPVDRLSIPHPVAWSGEGKYLSVWTGNNMQNEALQKLYSVSERIRLCTDKTLLWDWSNIQSTDNFRYMSYNDAWGTHYENAYEAFINYMNVLSDFLQRVESQFPESIGNEELGELLKVINNQEKKIEQLKAELKKK